MVVKNVMGEKPSEEAKQSQPASQAGAHGERRGPLGLLMGLLLRPGLRKALPPPRPPTRLFLLTHAPCRGRLVVPLSRTGCRPAAQAYAAPFKTERAGEGTKYLGTERELTPGAEHATRHTDKALWNCTPGTYVMLVNQCHPQ